MSPGGGPDSGLGIALDGRPVGAGGRGEATKDGKADGGGTFARTELLPIEASEVNRVAIFLSTISKSPLLSSCIIAFQGVLKQTVK